MISNQNLKSVFSYVKSENIKIDFANFLYQAEKHPDYPTLLAISDTLSFFKIKNGAIQVSVSEIDLLPDHFVALLGKEKSNPQLYFIKKNNNIYFYTLDEKVIEISKSELESSWNNIVLLLEKSEVENIVNKKKSKLSWILSLLCLGLFVLTLIEFKDNIQTKLFFLFPIFGLLFSVSALKDLFGIENVLLNSFCNMNDSTGCTSVISSTKWKFFEFVNFSDLSIVFFSSQFLGLLLFLFADNIDSFFYIQKILLFVAIPILFLSIYYQKFVERKWCPICLGIIAIILLELVYLIVFQSVPFIILPKLLIPYGLIFMTVTIIWSSLKRLLFQQKELKEFQLKGIRFIHNYEIFKNTLLVSSKTAFKNIHFGNIILGNADARLKIIIVSSPFCRHCAEIHTIIEEIVEKYRDTVCFDIRFNFNDEQSDEKSKKIHQNFVRIYYDKGQDSFIKALHNWFENKDEDKLNSNGTSQLSDLKINEILKEQFFMNQENNITFTPAIIIDQYVFPKQYDRKELIHFINDLVEDEDFQ